MNSQLIRQAMNDPDRWVLQMDYVCKSGQVTRRTISPIRFVGAASLLALCLGREQPRQFRLAQMTNVKLVDAVSVLMPEPITEESN